MIEILADAQAEAARAVATYFMREGKRRVFDYEAEDVACHLGLGSLIKNRYTFLGLVNEHL